MPQEWLVRRAEQERDRRKSHAILRAATLEFREKMSQAIQQCLDDYNTLFPGERAHIETVNEGSVSVIRRIADPDYKYEGKVPEVRLQNEVTQMVMICTFPNNPGRDITFSLVRLEDGSVALAEGSIELACERILDPILFSKLAHGV